MPLSVTGPGNNRGVAFFDAVSPLGKYPTLKQPKLTIPSKEMKNRNK